MGIIPLAGGFAVFCLFFVSYKMRVSIKFLTMRLHNMYSTYHCFQRYIEILKHDRLLYIIHDSTFTSKGLIYVQYGSELYH